MAKTYKYKEYARVDKIEGNDTYRYLLSVSLTDGDEQKTALVIMQNPSKATKSVSDQTVNTVLKILHQFRYSKVHITNLIPLYGTDSGTISDLAENNLEIYKENDCIISKLSHEVSKVFVAWGGKNKFSSEFYNRRIEAIQRILQKNIAYCYRKNKNGTPLHPSRGRWKDNKQESEFIEYTF